MTPEELFNKSKVQNPNQWAEPTRNFFSYYTDGLSEPMGFSDSERIDLNPWDTYQCPEHDKCWGDSRLSVLTTDRQNNLRRCGSDQALDDIGFDYNFYLVMYYRIK